MNLKLGLLKKTEALGKQKKWFATFALFDARWCRRSLLLDHHCVL